MDWQKAPRSIGFLVLLSCAGCVSGQTQAERGEELYGYCEQCHGATGQGNPDIRVPAIAGLDQWYVENELHKFRIGARGDHPMDTDGLRMRPMSRTLANDGEVSEVAAYVASLPKVDPPDEMSGGDPTHGQALFTQPIDGSQPCITCHGQQAQGNHDMNGPPLQHQSDWYLVAQLHKFREGYRGTDVLDVTGITMRPQALALPDDQAILDVVSYIETLDN